MKIIVAVVALLGMTCAFAGPVKGYVKKDGTYVEPHQRTSPNDTKLDNYSTKGNTNPYNGKEGTVDPNSPKPAPALKPLNTNPYKF